MSGTKKSLLWISSAVVAFLFLCGGLACYFSGPRVTTDPEEVLKIQSEILHIDRLPAHQPASGCRHASWGRKIKIAMFGKEQFLLTPSLMIIETQTPTETESQLDEAFLRNVDKPSPEDRVEFSEIKKITIEGQERSFQFSNQITQTDEGTELRTWTIYGIVFSKSGTASLFISIPEMVYDESEVIRMLESIHR